MKDQIFQKFTQLSSEDLAGAYDVLYRATLSENERIGRPQQIKVRRIIEVFRGDVTPGCSSKEWFLFFDYLNECVKRGSVLP